VEFRDVSAFIVYPPTNEVFLIPLEGRLHAREHIASRALNRHLGRGVDYPITVVSITFLLVSKT
jgi:hypothetical protein